MTYNSELHTKGKTDSRNNRQRGITMEMTETLENDKQFRIAYNGE